MFTTDSRYATAGTYIIQARDGKEVAVTKLPVRPAEAIRGFHQRNATQRPDLIAAHYLGNATHFWRLCDAGDAMAPDALASRDVIAVPARDR